MKKLALALVCLLSVAFFASCNKEIQNPEPSIAVMTGENFVSDGQTVDVGVTYSIGFRAASNAQTGKELAKFTLNSSLYEMDGSLFYSADTTFTASGTEYVFQNDNLKFENYAKELVGKAIFTATIIDVDGRAKFVTLSVDINQPAQPLEPVDFEWNRHGGAAVTGGIEEIGLKWERNGSKEDFAVLEPMEGAVLYGFTSDDWGETVTDLDKAQLFSPESMHVTMDKFTGVSAWSTKDYDFVIGTLYNGEYHLVHITKGIVETFKGTDVTIKGQIK